MARALTDVLHSGIMILTLLPEVGVAGRKQDDPKVRALRETRSLNPRPEVVSDEAFSSSEFLDARDLVQVKYEMVRRVRVDGEPVARAAERFGFSRPSFYAAQAALDQGGLPGLVPQRPGPRRAHKLSVEVLAFVRERREADPSLRPRDLVEPVAERFGIDVHPRSIERALAREGQQPDQGREPKRGQR
jgi:transposase